MDTRYSLGHSASAKRLDQLIAERLKPGADKIRIDERIWDLFGEEWCVMFTDLSGFSRRVAEFGIIHFLQTIHESERILLPVIEYFDGILLKIEGDSFLVIFRKPKKGLHCAFAMERRLAAYNIDKKDEDKVLLGVGLGFGRLLRIGDSDVFGAEVNAASKLGEDRAGAGDVLVTGAVKDACQDLSGLAFQSLPDPPAGCASAYSVKELN